jgi:2-hydroxycarboxylate transporter family
MDAAREDTEDEKGAPIGVGTVAAAGLAAITLYLLRRHVPPTVWLPAPVAMLFLAVLAKLTSAVSPHLQQGGFVVYKFFSMAVTFRDAEPATSPFSRPPIPCNSCLLSRSLPASEVRSLRPCNTHAKNFIGIRQENL